MGRGIIVVVVVVVAGCIDGVIVRRRIEHNRRAGFGRRHQDYAADLAEASERLGARTMA